MRTLVLEEPGRLLVTDTPEPPAPGKSEVVVRVRRVGICGTDIHAYRGNQPFFTYPRILGHELGVEIASVGPGVTHVTQGDRCAVEPYINCGKCQACRLGRTNCCETLTCLGVHGDGGMRELITLPASKVHPSTDLSLDSLALVETLGIGKHAVDRANVQQGETVAVIGLGPIGLTAAQFATLAGARVVGIDLSESRRTTATTLLGIETLDLMPNAPIAEQWRAAIGDLPLKVFDATGSRASMQSAFSLPTNGGTLTFIGLVLGEIAFNDPEFHRKELTLLASRNSVGRDFREIIEHMETGRVDPSKWITHRAEASRWPEVFESWLEPSARLLKGVIGFD
ncbi:MAG: zinc-binding alcohol dehydrogenase family protein [Planctomycetota bacterium]